MLTQSVSKAINLDVHIRRPGHIHMYGTLQKNFAVHSRTFANGSRHFTNSSRHFTNSS